MRRTPFLALALIALALSTAACSTRRDPANGPEGGASWNVVNVYVYGPEHATGSTTYAAPARTATPMPPCPPTPPRLGSIDTPKVCKPGDADCNVPLATTQGFGRAPIVVLFLGSVLAALYATRIRRKRPGRHTSASVVALALFLALPLAGCVGIRPLASKDDVDTLREDMAKASEAQRDAYNAALAEGKSPEQAAAIAFGAGATANRTAQADHPPSPEGGLDLAEILGIVLGGGTVGTIITRLMRGSPLRSAGDPKRTPVVGSAPPTPPPGVRA